MCRIMYSFVVVGRGALSGGKGVGVMVFLMCDVVGLLCFGWCVVFV